MNERPDTPKIPTTPKEQIEAAPDLPDDAKRSAQKTKPEIKRIDVREFREQGFLQELNRQFLHPRGLALEVLVNEDGSESIGGVWDYRDDPEGIVFAEGPDPQKAQNAEDELERHRATRIERFGWVVQPIGEGLDDRE